MAKEVKSNPKPDSGSINRPNIGDNIIKGENPKLPTMENPPPPPPKDNN